MERSLCNRGQKSHTLSSSLTADSLDFRQLLAPERIQSLISESATFDTLSSSSSDQVPPFSARKLPGLSIIGLGDHLKMFSRQLSQPQEPLARTDVHPKVIITSPTSPRLKSLLKERLCISKWAECLTGLRAPGHVPWGNILDQTTVSEKWLPEGSLYSPEDFSRALHEVRAGHVHADATQSEQEPHAIISASFNKDSTTTETVDPGSSSRTLTHIELVDMMRKLKDLKLKNFFEGHSHEVSRTDQQPKHSEQLPSLMISNSHCTFPLSLDSCQSVTLKSAANLANRRGRKPPPPLLLKNETMSPELSYPGIPTAFLGSPSTYSPKFQDVNIADTSGLCIEEMIKNLRLQCSSMALYTPPVDISWNSRSCPPSTPACEPVKKQMEAEVESSIQNTTSPDQPNNASSENLGERLVPHTVPTGRQKATSLVRYPQTGKCTRTARPDTPDKKLKILSKHTAPLLLRSSLAKHPTFQPRSLKSVRFALSPSEFEKDVTSLMYDDVWRLSQVSAHNHLYNAAVKKNPAPQLNPAPEKEMSQEGTHLIRQKSWRPTSTTFRVSSGMKAKERIKSIIIKPRHSMIPTNFYGNAENAVTQDNDRPQRSSQSQGRHSFSRIIKKPIFSGNENKRATVSNTFSTRLECNEKGTAVRDSIASDAIQKKSRMPVPLRSILIRFK